MPRRALTLPALVAALLISACGEPVPPTSPPYSLVTGRRAAPLPSAQLATATAAARTFARAWVPTIYLRRPPPLQGATSAVRRAQLLEAARVPLVRRHLRPRVAGVELKIAARRVQVDIRVVDGRSPAFSVGATLELRPEGWQVVTISTPG
ncbi:MAG: hypothetical protein JWO14_2486 [Solirubrobacterales bacterium]|nr:hypothetical protein [Solirubrobacterales bacterium]